MTQRVIFELKDLNMLRRAANVSTRLPEKIPEGWSKSKINPAKLLQGFDSLWVKKGFALRAYLFREGGNGNGFVWAMPADADFPEPDQCHRVDIHFLSPPKPPLALDDVMEAIDGDQSAWSYLSASLFKREVREFGAMWHGIDWGTHSILGQNPLEMGQTDGDTPIDFPRDPTQWNWTTPAPKEWRPQVNMGKGNVKVTIYTISDCGQYALYRHVDTYRRGRYSSKTTTSPLATGPSGTIF